MFLLQFKCFFESQLGFLQGEKVPNRIDSIGLSTALLPFCKEVLGGDRVFLRVFFLSDSGSRAIVAR